MKHEFKVTRSKDQTIYTLESATGGSTSAGSIASVDSALGGVQKRNPPGDNILAQEKKETPKPRNFVAKNAKMGGAGQHKDKKKAVKQGDVKHKKPLAEDHEIQMASSELQSIAKNAVHLLDLVRKYSEQEGLEAWQQSKITKSADYLNSVLQSISGKQSGMEETRNNYHANTTGFSRGQRDPEGENPQVGQQVWGLKINGKVWSKDGKDVTFTSKEAALNTRNSILKNRPDLEIGLVTKGGVSEGVAEGSDQITEYRNRLLQYVKSLLPTWPEYVLKDWLVPNKGDFSNLPDTELKNGIMEKLKGAGLTPNSKWQLVPDMKFTMDMFDPMTKQRLIGRAGGSSDLGMGIPRDKERHATQAALAQQQGGVRKEPVLLIKTNKGYELLEGWHRTIQHFAKYPDGYTGPAYVAVAQGQQGVAEEQLDELSCWSGYHKVAGTKAGFPGSCAKNKTNESEHSETCPHCGGEMVSEDDYMESLTNMLERSVSQAQHNLMVGVAHNPAFAQKVKVKQKVGQEFARADQGHDISKLPIRVPKKK